MKQPAKLLFAACLTSIVAAAGSSGANAAEDEAAAQDLVQVRASEQVIAAHWTRQQDSYVLQVVLDPSWRREKATTDPVAPAAAPEKPQPSAMPVPAAGSADGAASGPDRASFFIANTVANLRGLNPSFTCGRTLSLVDGRRSVDGQPPAPRPPQPSRMNQPYPPRSKDGRVEVWLLKADGTQILPTTYSCDGGPSPATRPAPAVEISYEFPLAGGEQAVAAAIRIGGDYYIEKLQTTAPKPAAR